MKKLWLLVTVALVAALVPAGAAKAACPTGWGSTVESSTAHPDSVVVTARAGQHDCFDRFVVVVEGGVPGYEVRYVKKFVPDASGRAVDLRGNATLQITMLGARAHDENGDPTYVPETRRNMVDVSGFRTLKQAYWGGTFEGTTVVGLGVRARLPFRVFSLAGTGDRTRLVIDIAHAW